MPDAAPGATTGAPPRGRPTVVLVHGAWHDASCFAALGDALAARDVRSIALDRPGHGTSAAPRTDLLGDADALRRDLDAIAGPKVLVGHSYGGAVIGQAAAARGDVVHLVFVAAFVLEVGESPSAQDGAPPFEPTPLHGAIQFRDDGTAVIDPALATDAFYNECDAATARVSVEALQPQTIASLGQAVTEAAWHDMASTYVLCTRDQAIAPSLQRFLAARTGRVVEIDADHSPFLSRTDELADVLAQVTRDA